jgi:hypothetical protein
MPAIAEHIGNVICHTAYDRKKKEVVQTIQSGIA